MSIYIHIPFCNTICSYCDFCKMLYEEKYIDKYLDALEREIRSSYKNELINTIYIGGGTPSSLSVKELEKLFQIIKIFKLNKNTEFTFECNIESLDEDKIKILVKNNVNRVSIGIESFDKKNLEFLKRNMDFKEIKNKIKLLKKHGIYNINVDLIYAISNETIKVLKKDLNLINKLKIKHVSTYSLIIEDNTYLKINNINNIDQDLDYKMYKCICKYLKRKGYIHYETSNFAKKRYESKHNLTYWNNDKYYGFGLGASGYIDNIRYTNTRSFTKYINDNYILEKEEITEKIEKENEIILGLRKIKGISKDKFYKKYNEKLEEKEIIKKLIKKGLLNENNEYICINPKYIYTSNDILVDIIGEV